MRDYQKLFYQHLSLSQRTATTTTNRSTRKVHGKEVFPLNHERPR